MTNEELKNMLFIIDTLLDDAITDSTRQKVKDNLIEVCQLAMKALEQKDALEKIRAEIKAKIEEEEFARSVFRHEEKDTYKAEQCTGSIMAYNNVIKLIDKYKSESEDAE